MIENIDVEKLINDADTSCCKESYLVVHKNSNIRIGAGARMGGAPLLFFDIAINLCPGDSNLDTTHLERGIALAKQLREIGYSLDCQEGQINCEKVVTKEKMNSEYKAIQHLLSEQDI